MQVIVYLRSVRKSPVETNEEVQTRPSRSLSVNMQEKQNRCNEQRCYLAGILTKAINTACEAPIWTKGECPCPCVVHFQARVLNSRVMLEKTSH